MSKIVRRTLTKREKDDILFNQAYRCANKPNNPAINLSDYKCPLWIKKIRFSNYNKPDFDHIDELSISKNNKLSNFQALCKKCHAEKTSRWKKGIKGGYNYTSRDIEQGCKPMDTS